MELSLGDMMTQLEQMGICTEGCHSKEDCVAKLLEVQADLDAKERKAAAAIPSECP